MTTFRTAALRAVLGLSTLALAAPPAAAGEGALPHWTYEGAHGPAHWGRLAREFEACALGKYQSPIDVREAKAADLPPLAFTYRPAPLRVVDNGHTVQVTWAPGSTLAVGDRRWESSCSSTSTIRPRRR